MQALGVAAAPRELQQARARRARNAQRVGQPRLVESIELADRDGRAERPLRARVVKAAHRLEADGRTRDSRRDFEAEGQGGEERDAVEALALGDRQRRWQHGAAGMRTRERLALERADEHAVGERGTRDVRTPAMMDDRRLGRAPEGFRHRHDPLGPRLPGAHERGADRVEDGDLEVLDQAPRQVGELGVRHEPRERSSLVHASPARVYRGWR